MLLCQFVAIKGVQPSLQKKDLKLVSLSFQDCNHNKQESWPIQRNLFSMKVKFSSHHFSTFEQLKKKPKSFGTKLRVSLVNGVHSSIGYLTLKSLKPPTKLYNNRLSMNECKMQLNSSVLIYNIVIRYLINFDSKQYSAKAKRMKGHF